MRPSQTPRASAANDARHAARNARAASLVAAAAAILVAVLLIVADVSAEPSELSESEPSATDEVELQ